MKLEQGKFTHAIFANDKKDLIRALWQDEATKQHYEYTMEIDLNNEIYQKLLETFTTSEISSMTEQQHKRSQAMYETFLKNVGVKYGLLYNPSALHPKEAFNIDHLFDLPNSNDGNDFLFNIKIKIFDLPQVANSNNKDLKKKLRESKTPIEALYIAGKFLYE